MPQPFVHSAITRAGKSIRLRRRRRRPVNCLGGISKFQRRRPEMCSVVRCLVTNSRFSSHVST